MAISRRTTLALAAAALPSAFSAQKGTTMYGLMGRIKAAPGKRDELAAILLEGSGDMPGCLSYVVAKDLEDADALWVTEAWVSEADHKGSLNLPSVKAAIAKARPIIAGFDQRRVTEPVGGFSGAWPSR